MLLLQFMLMFTDFTTDPLTRYEYGYYLLYYVGTVITLNIIVLIYTIVIIVRRTLRVHHYKKLRAKLVAERLAKKTKILEQKAKAKFNLEDILEESESEEHDSESEERSETG